MAAVRGRGPRELPSPSWYLTTDGHRIGTSRAKKTEIKKTKKPKTAQDVFNTLGFGMSPTDFGSGRHGQSINLWSNTKDKKLVGTLRLIEREDGEYSVSFEVAWWLKRELAAVGMVIHERAKPTRKARNILQIARMGG